MNQLIHPLEVIERFASHDFSVFDFFTQRVKSLGSAPMEFENRVLTWNEAALLVEKASAWLFDQGVKPNSIMRLPIPFPTERQLLAISS